MSIISFYFLIADEDTVSKEEQKAAIRKYQTERLKYYYAIVDLESVETAKTVFKECQGVGIGRTEMIVSLKYVPADMDFDDVRILFIIRQLTL